MGQADYFCFFYFSQSCIECFFYFYKFRLQLFHYSSLNFVNLIKAYIIPFFISLSFLFLYTIKSPFKRVSSDFLSIQQHNFPFSVFRQYVFPTFQQIQYVFDIDDIEWPIYHIVSLTRTKANHLFKLALHQSLYLLNAFFLNNLENQFQYESPLKIYCLQMRISSKGFTKINEVLASLPGKKFMKENNSMRMQFSSEDMRYIFNE